MSTVEINTNHKDLNHPPLGVLSITTNQKGAQGDILGKNCKEWRKTAGNSGIKREGKC
jgi:hypothetical protein